MINTSSLGNNNDEPPSSSSKRKIILKTPEKKTGFFPVQPDFLITEVVSNIDDCFALFKKFSPEKNLFETWEFRQAFYQAYRHQPYFLVLRNNHQDLALLPLWYDQDKKRYTWFGSDWQEEVSFFSTDPSFIPLLLSAAPSPLYLNAIDKASVTSLLDQIDFKDDAPKYILRLENFKNHEDFLMSLKKNRRHGMRKDWKRIQSQNPEITINNFNDIDQLISLAKKRFADKGQRADWEDPRRIATFKEIIRLKDKSYRTRMITIKINGIVAGVDLICLYQDTYFAVKCGYNVSQFSGIGNFMNLFEINDALELGMKKIDFLQNNYEWKEGLFESLPLVRYEK